MNYKTMIKRIDSLPPLSNTTIIVLDLYAQGAAEVDVSKLIKAIESDALLTANILKMINSPLYGFSKQIISVSQAVTLFGTEIIFGLVVRYSISSAVIANLRAYGVSNKAFNEICHLQSTLMRQWYAKINLLDAQFLAPLALIMESGKLIFAKEITQTGQIKTFAENLATAENISEYEDSIFHTSSYYVSGLLFEHWNFQPIYADILKGLDYFYEPASKVSHYVDALDVVRTAVNVKNVFSNESMREACEIVSDMNLEVDYFITVAKNIKDTYTKKIR